MTTYYVRKTGSDSNAGTSAGAAWLTMAHATASTALVGGDIIYVGAGTYGENVNGFANSGVQLSTKFTGTGGTSISNLGTTLPVASVAGLVVPPSGYYALGVITTSAGTLQFTYTGISGLTLTGVVFHTNAYVTTAATVATNAAAVVSCPIYLIGDVDGSQTGDAGEVVVSCYHSGNTAAPTATTQNFNCSKNDWTFAWLTSVGDYNGMQLSRASATTYSNHTVIDCVFTAFSANSFGLNVTAYSGTTDAIGCSTVIDRCIVTVAGGDGIFVNTDTSTVSPAVDMLVLIRNCKILGGTDGIYIQGNGTNSYPPGGVRIYGCTILFSATNCVTQTTGLSTTIHCEISNNFFSSSSSNVSASTTSIFVSSYNIFNEALTNVTLGTGDVSNSTGNSVYTAPTIDVGQNLKLTGVGVPIGTPRPGQMNPTGSSTPTGSLAKTDLLNRPRPSGGGSAKTFAGSVELHDTSIQDTTVYPSGQTSSAKMTGPGDTEIWVPVDAVSTTIGIQLYQGSGYTGTAYATATLLSSGELGIAAQTVTCASTLSAWQTLTFSAITASKAGWVKVRVTSFDTSGTGTLNFGALTAV